ncbi:MAG: hypothetical protein ACJ8IK_26130 [Burkholderiaceae bacterium]
MFRRGMLVLVFGLACGWAGWAGARMAASAAAAGRPHDASSGAPAPHTLFAAPPTIALAPDGRVTLHVDGEPLQWVLAEIDRQAGHAVSAAADHADSSRRIGAATETACSVARAPEAQDVVARVMRGTETERYDTLVQARSGGAISEEMLRTLYQSDASPRVRLLAFEYAQEATEGDPGARRAELEAARVLPDAVVAQEAGRRLEALDAQARRAVPQVATAR